MNHTDQNFINLSGWVQNNLLTWTISRQSYRQWIILTKVSLNYLNQFEEILRNQSYLEGFMRNEVFQLRLYSTILSLWKDTF